MTLTANIDNLTRPADSPTTVPGTQLTQATVLALLHAAHMPRIPDVDGSDHQQILNECKGRWLEYRNTEYNPTDKLLAEASPADRFLIANLDNRIVVDVELNTIAPQPGIYGLPEAWTSGSFVDLARIINSDDHRGVPANTDPRLANMLAMAADVFLADDETRTTAYNSLTYFPPLLVPITEYFAAKGLDATDVESQYLDRGIQWIALDGNARLATLAATELSEARDGAKATAVLLTSDWPHAVALRGVEELFAEGRASDVDVEFLALIANRAVQFALVRLTNGAVLAGMSLSDDLVGFAATHCSETTLNRIASWELEDPGFLSDDVWSIVAARNASETLPVNVSARIRAAQTRRSRLDT